MDERIADKRLRLDKESLELLFSTLVERGVNVDQIAVTLGVSTRTVRDWRRGKYTIPQQYFPVLLRFSGLSRESLVVEELPKWWAVHAAAKEGGRAYMAKYGSLGTPESRRAGGEKSYALRAATPGDIFARKTVHIPESSDRLAEFVGIMMGDGSVGQYQASVALDAITDREYLAYVVRLAEELFGIRVHIQERPKQGCVVALMSSAALTDLLVGFGLPRGHKLRAGLAIPTWVLEDDSYATACVRGLFDTDGSLFYEKHHHKGKVYAYPRLAFVSASLDLCVSVMEVLDRLGIRACVRGGRNVCVERFTDIEKYFRIVGSSNPKHLRRFVEYGGVG